MTRTTREISWRVSNINKRLSSNIHFQAGIHGVKLKNTPALKPKVPFKKLEKNQEDNLQKLINNRIKKVNSNGR